MNMTRIFPWLLASLLVISTAMVGNHRYELVVDGLACPFCAYGIEKKFSRLPGVENVDIDIDGGKVFITMAEGETLSQAEATKAVSDAGFTLRAFSRPAGQ